MYVTKRNKAREQAVVGKWQFLTHANLISHVGERCFELRSGLRLD